MRAYRSRRLITAVGAVAALALAAPLFAANNTISATVWPGLTGFGVDQVFGRVTVCVPGTARCQVVGGLLIDTGSFGLRIFAQALTIPLPVEMSSGQKVAECAFFGSLNTWGRVGLADVKMGGEPTIPNLPVQILNPTFPSAGHRPAGCPTPAHSPQEENFNGILGVGLLQADGALTDYYTCTSSSCNVMFSPPPVAQQVQNPVALLPGNPANAGIPDDNGVLLKLPGISGAGAQSITGQLVFGINTQADNTIPVGYQVYTADPNSLSFTTTFMGNIAPMSFLDSGSNGFFFDDPGLPTCGGGIATGWYCPGALVDLNARTTGQNSISKNLTFFINNAMGLFLTGNSAFSDLGANVGAGSGFFDWGLPFFIGRKIFVGIEGKSVSGVAAATPWWAYK